jgi:hypothetical protein
MCMVGGVQASSSKAKTDPHFSNQPKRHRHMDTRPNRRPPPHRPPISDSADVPQCDHLPRVRVVAHRQQGGAVLGDVQGGQVAGVGWLRDWGGAEGMRAIRSVTSFLIAHVNACSISLSNELHGRKQTHRTGSPGSLLSQSPRAAPPAAAPPARWRAASPPLPTPSPLPTRCDR